MIKLTRIPRLLHWGFHFAITRVRVYSGLISLFRPSLKCLKCWTRFAASDQSTNPQIPQMVLINSGKACLSNLSKMTLSKIPVPWIAAVSEMVWTKNNQQITNWPWKSFCIQLISIQEHFLWDLWSSEPALTRIYPKFTRLSWVRRAKTRKKRGCLSWKDSTWSSMTNHASCSHSQTSQHWRLCR